MNEKTDASLRDRCRLCLIAPDLAKRPDARRLIEEALDGGDVAALILANRSLDENAFQRHAADILAVTAERAVALLIAEDIRTAGRIGADGVHLDDAREVIAERDKRFDNRLMFGAGGAKTRHDALELGEAQPDYIFFGRIGYDAKPTAHPRNLSLGAWWSDMVEIPAMVMAGSTFDSVGEVMRTRAEFVAVERAVFNSDRSPGEAVAAINDLLERDAPDLSVPGAAAMNEDHSDDPQRQEADLEVD